MSMTISETMSGRTVKWKSPALLLFWLGSLFPAMAAVSVEDATGQRVELTKPAQRIVSLAPHITELLFTIGAGERLVGAVNYSDYPPAWVATMPSIWSASWR